MVLYRGISKRLDEKNNGELKPKKLNYEFKDELMYNDKDVCYDELFTQESSIQNAIIRHQAHQKGNLTSGISTTPPL